MANCVVSFTVQDFGAPVVEGIEATLSIVSLPSGDGSGFYPSYTSTKTANASGLVTFDGVPQGCNVRVVCRRANIDSTFTLPASSTYTLTPSSAPPLYLAPGSSVLNYGAVDDGVTDNAAAILAAINANPGGTVYFPYNSTGVYLIKSPVRVNARSTALRLQADPGVWIKAAYADGFTEFYDTDVNGNRASVMFTFDNPTADLILDGLNLDGDNKVHEGILIWQYGSASNLSNVHYRGEIKNLYWKVADRSEYNALGIGVLGAFGTVRVKAYVHDVSREAGSSIAFDSGDVVTGAGGTIFVGSGHSLWTGMPLLFASTGSLPGGISSTTTVMYAILDGTDKIKLASSRANALAGTAINITSGGSGDHTLYYGAGWPQSRVSAGVFVGGLLSGTALVRFADLRGCRIENVGTAQTGQHPFNVDCDGILCYQIDDTAYLTAYSTNSCVIADCSFRNIKGRFLKVRGDNAKIVGNHGFRAVEPLAEVWGGQYDWDLQTGSGLVAHNTTEYETTSGGATPFNALAHACYAVKSSGTRSVGVSPKIADNQIYNRVAPATGRLLAMVYVDNPNTDATGAYTREAVISNLTMRGGAAVFAVDSGRYGQYTRDRLTIENVFADKILVSLVGTVDAKCEYLDLKADRCVNLFGGTIQTCTVDASTDVVTVTTDLPPGQLVRVTAQTTMPTGLESTQDYYWERASATTGYLHRTFRSALAGTASGRVDIQSTGSGTLKIQAYTRRAMRNPSASTSIARIPGFTLISESDVYGFFEDVRVADAAMDTQNVVPTQSLSLNGTTGSVTIPDAAQLDFGTGDFAVGLAGTFTSLNAKRGAYPVWSKVAANVGVDLWLLDSKQLQFRIGNGSDMTTYAMTSQLPVTRFANGNEKARVHVKVNRAAQTVAFYVNGNQLGDPVAIPAGAAAQTVTNAADWSIGTDGSSYGLFEVEGFAAFGWAVGPEAFTERGVPPQYATGSLSATYASDFSAGVDGWTGTRGTAAGNIDSIGSLDDWLRLTVDGTADNTHFLEKASILTAGQRYRLEFTYFIASANSVLKSIRVHDTNGYTLSDSDTTSGELNVSGTATSVSLEFTAGATGIRFYAADVSGSGVFDGNSADVMYVRGVSIRPLGAVCRYSGMSLKPDRRWFDLTSNANHATYSSGATLRVPMVFGEPGPQVRAFRASAVYPPTGHQDTSIGAVTFTADRAYLWMMDLPPSSGITRIGIRVDTLEAGRSCRLGIIGSDKEGFPDRTNVLVDAGTVDVGAAGPPGAPGTQATIAAPDYYGRVWLVAIFDATAGAGRVYGGRHTYRTIGESSNNAVGQLYLTATSANIGTSLAACLTSSTINTASGQQPLIYVSKV